MSQDPPGDLRPLLFSASAWYEALSTSGSLEEADSNWPAWRVTVSNEEAWWYQLLNVAAAFARDHHLLDRYQKKFAGISLNELSRETARIRGRSELFPVWEITNELIVGRYLERVVGWQYCSHEPKGRQQHRGDWEFTDLSGKQVFVEVKSLAEPEPGAVGVYSRPSFAHRLRTVLKGAYRQLPDDGRSTLVVVVGRDITRIPFGVMHGDLFQALYGQMQINFRVMPYDPESVRVGPSFREMFVHGTKHRRLGAVAGLAVSGDESPSLRFYSIQNPYANTSVKLDARAFADTTTFVVDEHGHGKEFHGIGPEEVWHRIAI